MRGFRVWGYTLVVLGVLTLILAWREIDEPFVFDLIIAGAILVGHLLPLPATVENRLRRWGIVIKLVVLVIGVGLYAALMVGINKLTGLQLQYGPPITFLLVGLVILASSQFRVRRGSGSSRGAADDSAPAAENTADT